jgi:AraC-like DNA-binding protein
MPWNAAPAELEAAPRPLVAIARDYPRGHRIAPHRHRRAQLVHAARGLMTVRTEEGAWVVPPGSAVWMPAGVEHWIDCAGALQMRSVWLAPEAARDLPERCAVLRASPLLRALILRAVDLPILYDEAGAEGRLVAVLLDEIAAAREAPLHLPMPRDARLGWVADALLADPADGRGVAAWAREAGASARTFERLFRRDTGLSFGAWRSRARVLAALALLAEGRSVTATALELGYDSVSAFIAMFRRALGETPGRYLGRAA